MEEKELIKQMEEKRKLPKKVKEEMLSKVGECALSAIIVYAYFIFLKLGIKNIHSNIYLTDLKVFSVSFAVVSVIFFETAYNKKSSRSLYIGIEVLVLAMVTMLVQYLVIYLVPKYRIMIPIFAIIFNIYFILKALVLVHKTKRDYIKKLSDIKEIIEKPRRKKT